MFFCSVAVVQVDVRRVQDQGVAVVVEESSNQPSILLQVRTL
jgi:hypothetical protein